MPPTAATREPSEWGRTFARGPAPTFSTSDILFHADAVRQRISVHNFRTPPFMGLRDGTRNPLASRIAFWTLAQAVSK